MEFEVPYYCTLRVAIDLQATAGLADRRFRSISGPALEIQLASRDQFRTSKYFEALQSTKFSASRTLFQHTASNSRPLPLLIATAASHGMHLRVAELGAAAKCRASHALADIFRCRHAKNEK